MRINTAGASASVSSNANDTRGLPIAAWLLLALLWFGLLGYRALIHSDEGRYAEIALEMMRTGDWVTPRLDGLLYFEKPPLQYWLTVFSYHLFGINEFAARFWTALSGFLTIVTCSATASRLWGKHTGAMTAWVAAGMTWIIANGHLLTLDMGLTFFLTLALCAFLLAAQDGTADATQRRWMQLAWAAMAGAALSKGLIGLIVPGGAFTFYSLATLRSRQWRLMRWVSGPVIFLLLAAPWFIVVSQRNPGFAYFFFIHEHFQRFLTHEAHREGPVWYFLPLLIGGLLPWTTLLPSAIRHGLRADRNAGFATTTMLLAWASFVFLFFSASGSKLPSYILPLFPALALVLGRYLAQYATKRIRWHLLAPALLWVALAVFASQLSQHINDVPLADLTRFAHTIELAAGLYLLLSLAVLWLSVRYMAQAVIGVLAITNLLALNIAMVGHDAYARQKTTRDIAPKLLPYLKPDTAVFSVRTYDQTLPFYLGRLVTIVEYDDEFEYGEGVEPTRWVHKVADFTTQWRSMPQAMAVMGTDTYKMLLEKELPMKVVFQDGRRVAVVKP